MHRTTKPFLAPAICLALLAGAMPARAQQGITKQLAGMWRLVGNPQRLGDGTTRQSVNTVGYAFFDASATHMCFLTMNPNRSAWKSDSTPTPEEAVAALRGFGAYCATLEIHEKEGFMLRRYDLNQTPNAVGKTTKRWYAFQDADHMSLRVDREELGGSVIESTFVWERVK